MNLAGKIVGLMILGALLAGCGSMADKEAERAAAEGAVGPEGTVGTGEQGAIARGVGGTTAFQGHPLDDPASPLSRRVVYFEFDSSTVTDEGRQIIQSHADYLASAPGVAVLLEGHADERGTREYNVALSERRANAVEQLLILQGVAGQQLQTVSYGEERPAVMGHDEASWSMNRRVEIVYQR